LSFCRAGSWLFSRRWVVADLLSKDPAFDLLGADPELAALDPSAAHDSAVGHRLDAAEPNGRLLEVTSRIECLFRDHTTEQRPTCGKDVHPKAMSLPDR
jgi:hypothetical protein